MQKAAAEMGVKETFRGYGPEQGYGFLQEALVKYYAGFGVTLEASEVFISDGAKSDCGNITDIFDDANVILVPDPVWMNYINVPKVLGAVPVSYTLKEENNYQMDLDEIRSKITDRTKLLVLVTPNNPTGSNLTRETPGLPIPKRSSKSGWRMPGKTAR